MIIGLTGKAGTGKDTAADYLVNRHGFAKLSFATALKRGLNAMFGFSMKQWDDREWKETVLPELGKSPRQLAQTLGTEWGRQLVKQDLWPSLAMAEAVGMTNAVLTDVRFDNEAHAVNNEHGYVIRIERNVQAVAEHSSETGISAHLVADTIINNGSVHDMYDQLDIILFKFQGGFTHGL